MNERTEELASLYALDLLEGTEQAAFEQEMAKDSSLRKLVDDLRESASALALTASSPAPSAQLRERVMASISRLPKPQENERRSRPPGAVIPFAGLSWLGWAAAACLALVAAWFVQRSLSFQRELTATQSLIDIEKAHLQTVSNQLDAERVIARQQITDLKKSQQDLAALNDSLAQERSQATRQLADLQGKYDSATVQAARQLVEFQEKYDTVNRQSARQLAELQGKYDLANFKIARLVSQAGNTPEAAAIAVWNPTTQQGVLTVQKLPALATNQDYQLWMIDPQYNSPVDGGVFTVDPATGEGRMVFRPKQPVAQVTFAISREPKGGMPKPSGDVVLLGK